MGGRYKRERIRREVENSRRETGKGETRFVR